MAGGAEGDRNGLDKPSALRTVRASTWTLVDAAAERITEAISIGELRPGDQLPPERELVERLEVSRTVLREALSSLEALGLIESRSTRGRFVASGGSATHSRKLVAAWLHQHATEIADLDELRALLESHAINSLGDRECAETASSGRRIVDRQRAAVEAGRPDEAAQQDHELHALFVSHSHNEALRALAAELIERSRRIALAYYRLDAPARKSVADHEAIVAALGAGDRERATGLLWNHMMSSAPRAADEDPG